MPCLFLETNSGMDGSLLMHLFSNASNARVTMETKQRDECVVERLSLLEPSIVVVCGVFVHACADSFSFESAILYG